MSILTTLFYLPIHNFHLIGHFTLSKGLVLLRNMTSRKSYFILIQIIAWMLFCLLPIMFMPEPHHENHRAILNPFSTFVFIFFIINIKFIILFYVNYLVLIPKYFEKQKYWLYFILLSMLFLIVVSIPFIRNLIFENHHHAEKMSHHRMGLNHHGEGPRMPRDGIMAPTSGMHFFMSVIVALVPLLIYYYTRWVSTQKEKAEMELAFLKTQINHHFLFNSLNSIYALSEQKSENTSNAIMDLSTIMRYLLTETDSKFVPLKRELDYISHYVNLQKLRIPPNVKLDFQLKGDSGDLLIAPMILLTFIENCFKHGILTSKPCEIKIEIIVDNQILVLKTSNAIQDRINDSSMDKIGIENARKRLEHDYLNKYELVQNCNGFVYTVNLKMKLK